MDPRIKQKMKLNKTFIDSIALPQRGQKDYWDSDLKGFGLRVSPTRKTFFVRGYVNGKRVRYTIGTFGEFTADDARKEAKAYLGDMARGIDPNQKKRENREKGVTLGEAFERYVEKRQLKKKTVTVYRSCVNVCLSDWLSRPLAGITGDMVSKRHTRIGKERGEATANLAMRILRAVYTYSMEVFKDTIKENPVKRLSTTKEWYRVNRRRTVIKKHELPAWFRAVKELESPVARDYLLFLLFTGLRREEAASLKWADVDMQDQTFIIKDPKNHNPLELPMSDYIFALLKERLDLRENDHVFPGGGSDGQFREPKRQIAVLKEKAGITFTLHDLRRTFITIAEACEIGPYTLKALVNHSHGGNGDVTGGYIVQSPERLRGAMQKITSAILNACEPEKRGKVISING